MQFRAPSPPCHVRLSLVSSRGGGNTTSAIQRATPSGYRGSGAPTKRIGEKNERRPKPVVNTSKEVPETNHWTSPPGQQLESHVPPTHRCQVQNPWGLSYLSSAPRGGTMPSNTFSDLPSPISDSQDLQSLLIGARVTRSKNRSIHQSYVLPNNSLKALKVP